MPKALSSADQAALSERIAEYVREANLDECIVVLHGGEPLLVGADFISDFVHQVRDKVRGGTKVDFGMQTNGLLLTDSALDVLEEAGISVSLSLDGPREANDLHRTTRKGRSSFQKVEHALERLKKRPSIFAGVIAVVDPRVSPQTLFEYFDKHDLPKLDFLLPDAHHLRPPPGRHSDADLYRRWLVEAFDLWLDNYPHLPIRFFETLLDASVGLPSGTDALGFGDVSLLSIETDGTYHDLDVFKVVGDGVSRLSGSVRDTPISTVAASSAIMMHRRLLSKDGLCETCQACPVVDICGGGSVPHRHGTDGYNQPSIYCSELFSLINHAKKRIEGLLRSTTVNSTSRLPTAFDLARFEVAETGSAEMKLLIEDAERELSTALHQALDVAATDPASQKDAQEFLNLSSAEFCRVASWPGAVAWANAFCKSQIRGQKVHDVVGREINVDTRYLATLNESANWRRPLIEPHHVDAWLRIPFGDAIMFEPTEVAQTASPLVQEALDIISAWRPALSSEIRNTCRTIQFVRDPTAHPEKIVSFSDNSVPGALFVSVFQGERLIDPYDLADSLIHEHRHQKLYLLERLAPMVLSDTEFVASPWRADLRPPSGLLHAIFVFIELRRFWQYVLSHGPARMRNRASNQLIDTDQNLDAAFETLSHCPLSADGRKLSSVLDTARQKSMLSTASC